MTIPKDLWLEIAELHFEKEGYEAFMWDALLRWASGCAGDDL
jgi:hypothetical protein